MTASEMGIELVISFRTLLYGKLLVIDKEPLFYT